MHGSLLLLLAMQLRRMLQAQLQLTKPETQELYSRRMLKVQLLDDNVHCATFSLAAVAASAVSTGVPVELAPTCVLATTDVLPLTCRHCSYTLLSVTVMPVSDGCLIHIVCFICF